MKRRGALRRRYGRSSGGESRRLELYNIEARGRSFGNGYMVRVVKDGRTHFVRFGRDEAAARAYVRG